MHPHLDNDSDPRIIQENKKDPFCQTRDNLNDDLKWPYGRYNVDKEDVPMSSIALYEVSRKRDEQLHVSIVVSIPACHAGDRGSIPRRGVLF